MGTWHPLMRPVTVMSAMIALVPALSAVADRNACLSSIRGSEMNFVSLLTA